jgi:hypothetical protein
LIVLPAVAQFTLAEIQTSGIGIVRLIASSQRVQIGHTTVKPAVRFTLGVKRAGNGIVKPAVGHIFVKITHTIAVQVV